MPILVGPVKTKYYSKAADAPIGINLEKIGSQTLSGQANDYAKLR
jgi:hypothetical protein